MRVRWIAAARQDRAEIVWGRHDRIIPASHAENLPAHVKVTIFEDAGHVAHIEKPEDLARLI